MTTCGIADSALKPESSAILADKDYLNVSWSWRTAGLKLPLMVDNCCWCVSCTRVVQEFGLTGLKQAATAQGLR